MARIRARLPLRIIFVVLSGLLLVLCYPVVKRDARQEWKRYQDRYQSLYKEHLSRRLGEAEAERSQAEVRRLKGLLEEASSDTGHRIQQIFLPDAGVRDLCVTCHLGMENPLFGDAPHPLKSHPPTVLRDHKPTRFGCTLCHQGQGVGLTAAKAHGYEHNWPSPRVPARFLQGLCLGCHETPYGLEGAEKAERGRTLYVRHGCFGCHGVPRGVEALPAMSTSLDGAGSKISNKAWLYQWIKDPRSIRPATLMPTFRLEESTVGHIVAYLVSRTDLPRPLPAGASAGGSAREGARLFIDKGCKGCHSDDLKKRSLTDRIPNLDGAGLKLDSRWVAPYLEDPRAMQPQTPMPKVMLTEEERGHLAAYVVSLRNTTVAGLLSGVPRDSLQGDPDQGRKLVQLYGCYGCHPLKEMETAAMPGVEVAEVAKKKLDELPFGDTDIPRTKWDWILNKIKTPAIYETSQMPLKMPSHALTDEEVEDLAVYYLDNRLRDLPERYLARLSPKRRLMMQGEWYLEHYGCRGCHQIEKEGKPRIEEYLSLKSLVPPSLAGEADKVQPQWFFQFLSRPVALRPWLTVRMPEFGLSYKERQEIIDYFAGLGQADSEPRVPYVLLPVREDYDPKILAMGEYRIQQDKCAQCHPISFDGRLPEGVKVEDLSINLMLAKSRLRFEWIKNFLRNPDKYAGAGTKMPFVFYSPDGVPRMEDPEKWIEYASLYLMFMEKVPEPAKQEKIEEVRPGAETDWTQY